MDVHLTDRLELDAMDEVLPDDLSGRPEKLYKIGELADQFGVSLRTLRFYEDKGLLSPQREGNTRLYSRADRARLHLIILSKRLGFSLADIRKYLELYNPGEKNISQLRFALNRGEEQLLALEAERDKISTSIRELQETITTIRRMISEVD